MSLPRFARLARSYSQQAPGYSRQASTHTRQTAAKVSFMITSSQREALLGLSYQPSSIEVLTPQQAHTILTHRLTPTAYAAARRAQWVDQQRARRQQEERANRGPECIILGAPPLVPTPMGSTH